MKENLFSGSIRLSNCDSTIDEDKIKLDNIAKLNDWMLGNSYYCYVYGSLVLLINPNDHDLSAFKSLFNDGGKGVKPLLDNNNPE